MAVVYTMAKLDVRLASIAIGKVLESIAIRIEFPNILAIADKPAIVGIGP